METLLWIIYVVGVILTPIVVGATEKNKTFDISDDGLPLLMVSLVWPVAAVLFIGLVVGVGLLVVVVGLLWIPARLWVLLLYVGQGISNRFTPQRMDTDGDRS